jgi:hypothetical protein
MTRERRSYRHFALPMACAAFITTGLATATALAGASGALGALSPAAAARGVVDNELAGDWPASCPYFRPNFYAICLQASSKLDAEHFRLHGSVAVRGTVTQNTRALVEITGHICPPPSAGPCQSSEKPKLGMPGPTRSFAAAYSAAANPNSNAFSPIPCVQVAGRWYVDAAPPS